MLKLDSDLDEHIPGNNHPANLPAIQALQVISTTEKDVAPTGLSHHHLGLP